MFAHHHMTRTVHIGLWTAAVLVVLLLLLFYGGRLLKPFLGDTTPVEERSQESSGTLVAGSDAPYFELADLSGDRVRLSDFKNMPLLVTFWSTRESDARDQIKIFDDWTATHPDALFNVLTINSMEERSIVKNFISRGGYTAPVLLDKEGAAAQAYGIQTLPASFFIDGEGIIRDMYIGIMSQKMIEERSERILR